MSSLRAPVLFCTEGSASIGFGHVRRCLSLAEALRREHVESSFLLNGCSDVLRVVTDSGFAAHLNTDPASPHGVLAWADRQGSKVIVCDSYAFDDAFFSSLRAQTALIVAIDDLANTDAPVDIVVNGTLGAEAFRYGRHPGTELLLGAQYGLLRAEFAVPPPLKATDASRRVLISVGGSDPHRLTERLIACVEQISAVEFIDVVVGPLFSDYERAGWSGRTRVSWHRAPSDMRRLMIEADVAVSGGGQTLYELAAAGVPCVAIKTAQNQLHNLTAFEAAGIGVWVGDAEDADLDRKVIDAIRCLCEDGARRVAMGRKGRLLVDGNGANRVARAVVRKGLRH